MKVIEFIKMREKLIKKYIIINIIKEVLNILFLIFLFLLVLFINSCSSIAIEPYCNKINEEAEDVLELKENEKILLDCIEEYKLYVKHL